MATTAETFLDAPDTAVSAADFLDDKPAARALPPGDNRMPGVDYSPVNIMDTDAGRLRAAGDFERLRARYGQDFAARALSGQPANLPPAGDQLSPLPWYEMQWQSFRHSRTGRALFGPTADEQAAMASGAMPGPPGNQPGLLPLALTAPNPFLPSTDTAAGKVLLGAFIAQHVKNQPERIAAINDKFQTGDTKGAYHDILSDLIDTGMIAAGAHDLHGELGKGFETPGTRAARLIGENVDAADLGPIEPFAQAGGAPVNPELDAALRQGYQPARTAGAPVVPVLPGLRGQPRAEQPPVPETAAEPERNLTVTEEIRARKATTIAQIQDLYPKAELSREQARELRNAAWGAPEQPAPKPTAEQFLESEPEPQAPAPEEVNETEQPQNEPGPEDTEPPAEPATRVEPAKAPAEVPWWLHEQRRIVANIGPENVAKIAELSAQRKTAQEVAKQLGLDVNEVRTARAAQGIPSMDAATDFESWLADYNKAKAPAEPVTTVTTVTTAPEEQATFGAKKLPLGVSKAQWEEMHTLSANDQRAKFGVTSTELLQKAVLNELPVWWKVNVNTKAAKNLVKMVEATGPNDAIAKAKAMKGVTHVHEETARVATQEQPAVTTAPVEPPKSKRTPPKMATAKPTEAPAQAAAKVEDHVNTVAATEGQRPAREIKAELVDRVTQAVEAAPALADLTTEQQTAFGKVGRKIEDRELPSKGSGPKGETQEEYFRRKNAYIKDVRAAEVAAVEKTGLKRITIDIPGDGSFTVWNTKEALGEVLQRARGLETSTKPPKPYKESGIPKEDTDWVRAETAKQTAQTDPRKTYFIQNGKAEWLPVAGKPVVVPGFEGIEFFAHSPPGGGKGYKITEATTGLGVGGGYESSIKKAVEETVTRIKNTGVTPEKIRSLVEAAPKSPRVTGELPNATPRGSGAKIRTRPAVTEPEEAPAEPIKPDKINAVQRDLNRLRANVAPQSVNAPARYVGNLLRMLNSKMANEMLRADESLRPFRAHFDRTRLPADWQYAEGEALPHNLAFIDAYENGRTAQLPEVERRAAEEFKRQNGDWLDRVHQLGTGALQTFYENYFPHLWDDPAAARELYSKLLAKRPLEGPKSFLRERTHQLFVEGLKAGLRPVHDNPVDLWLLKKREVERYLLARNFINDTKAAGLLKFVHSFSRRPEGFSKVDDSAFTQWGPPNVPITEYFDRAQRAGLEDLLRYIGSSQKRLANLPHRGAIGLAYPPPIRENLMKAGADETTAWHELGHQMDWKFPELRERLKMRGNSPMAKQIRDLVDLRGEGQPVSDYEKKYFRETEEKIAEVFKAYLHAPELFQKTAPLAWDELNSWLGEHPDIKDRMEAIKPRLAHGSETTLLPINGLVKLGDWMLPDAAARVVNNYLSPGLNPHLWYRSLRETSNLLNGAQLGLSGFHLGFTSLDAATSRLALAIEDAARGDIGRALRTAASVPVSPLTNILQGAKVRAEVLKPGSQPEDIQQVARALEEAGGRVGQDRFWRTEFTRRMRRAISEGTASGYLKGAVQAPFALMEQTIKPIMDYVVPRQKLGVFADMARREMERLGPDATPEQSREAMRKAWDSVDNRMGQLVYDNLFYNRWIKDMALLSFRAYGWQLGKYREGIGAALDTGNFAKAKLTGNPAEFTHRMAYAMALPLMIGTLGAITTYLMTGRKPEGMDYFMPPTGEQDANGNPARLNFPSYMKDVLAYSKHPVTSFGHSLNPLFSGMMDLYQNKDFYNVEIRHPEDPLWQQGSEVAHFAAKQFVPFSLSGAKKLRDDASPVEKQILPFFGITPAPARMTMTPAQELAADLTSAGMGDLPRTKEQFDRGQIIRDAVRQMKSGKGDGLNVFGDAIASGKLNPDATTALIDRLKYSPLQFQVFHLDARAAIKVWRVANPQEREQLQPLLVTKIANSKALSLTEKQGLLGELVR